MRLIFVAVAFSALCLACASHAPAPIDHSKPIYEGRKTIFYDKGYYTNDMEEGANLR